jgi:type VI secretion system secreted protein VgrG
MTIPRLLHITSPLAGDELIVTRLHVTEQLGLPYRAAIDVLGIDALIKPSALLTKPVTVSVKEVVDEAPIERHFHGFVSEFERVGPGPSGRMAYRLALVPGIWRLGLRQNCRIFQNKSVMDIVDAVLAEHSLPAPARGILPTLSPMVYCTQFNETDLAFLSRLMEEHGLTYYFSHTASDHRMHVSATAPGFPAFVGGDVEAMHDSPKFYDLRQWCAASRARSASVMLKDMDGERSQPSVVQTKNSDTRAYADEPAMWAPGKVFHWPGGMSTRPGVDNAAVAMGERETASEEFTATTIDPRFAAGVRMTVAVVAQDRSRRSAQYVVTSVQHDASDASSLAAGSGGTEGYAASLRLCVASRAWMPRPLHPRPVMAGLYSAKVTGPAGEKIHVDEFGRIKVKFRWDHLGVDDDASSCWVRVMQAAGGAWGGTWFLPRVGDEVLVAFLDNDPDRPVVMGAVYGKDAKPPFLPGTNRAQSGFRSRSYKSDSSEDANILRFEDKKDSEEVFLHCQKDLKTEVEHDETRMVQNARTTNIKDSHDTLTVEKGNRVTTVNKGNDTLTVETGNRAVNIDTGNETHTIKMGNETHTIKMGDMTVKCDLGSVLIEAMQKITLKVGQSTVVIDQMGVTTKGMNITEEATLMHKTKAVMLQEDASAMVMVKGGIVMLN